jgi:hypothetical protein
MPEIVFLNDVLEHGIPRVPMCAECEFQALAIRHIVSAFEPKQIDHHRKRMRAVSRDADNLL